MTGTTNQTEPPDGEVWHPMVHPEPPELWWSPSMGRALARTGSGRRYAEYYQDRAPDDQAYYDAALPSDAVRLAPQDGKVSVLREESDRLIGEIRGVEAERNDMEQRALRAESDRDDGRDQLDRYATDLSGLRAEKQQLLDQELLHREQAGEMAEEIERLRAENERRRIALADSMAAPHTKTTDELVGWTRDLYVEFGKLLARQVKTGGELAQARRDQLRLFRALVMPDETDIDEAVEEAKRIYDERNQARRELEEAKGQADPKYTAGGGLNPTSNAVPATLEVDGESGAWYIRLLDEPVTRTTEQPGPVNVDWTADGRLVGVEVLPDQAGTGDTATLAQTFPFGHFLDEELKARRIPRRMLRRPLGLSEAEIDDLIEGRRELTRDLAARLGQFLGTTAELWLNLDRIHQASRPPLPQIEDPWETPAGLAATKDDYPDLPTGGRTDTATECTDMRCRRIDGRCVGMHCAKCGGPCGPQGHIGGCPPSQGKEEGK